MSDAFVSSMSSDRSAPSTRTCSACGTVEERAEVLFCGHCGTQFPDLARDNGSVSGDAAGDKDRKRITAIFCDVAGSVRTADVLGTDANDAIIDRYHEVVREVTSRHGGAVGAVVGDGVLIVFGVPTWYEDHAMRAVQAAYELRDALAEVSREVDGRHSLSFTVRMGIHTGEVLVGPDTGPDGVRGEPPNVANRLQLAAKGSDVGENPILLSQATLQLVRDAVEVDPVGPLKLEGVRQRVPAHRLVGLRIDRGAPRRRRLIDIPLVGRKREVWLLKELYHRTVAEQTCHLVRVLGPGGVGKTRLVGEFWNEIADDARVLGAHCLPYGEGVTYWPLQVMVRQAADIAPTDPPSAAYEKLRRLVGDEPGAARVTTGVAQMLGVGASAGNQTEIARAARRLLEILARERPLVIVIDDLHQAEATLLDAIEYIAEETRDTPVMLVCIAREELLERRRGWAGAKLNSFSLGLSPLTTDEEKVHIGHVLRYKQLDPPVHQRIAGMTDRIAELSEGFPLYAEEYVSMLEDLLAEGKDSALEGLPAPPTIDDLMNDRLFRLSPDERAVIQRAAVVGKQFHVADVVALTPEHDQRSVELALELLARRELVQRDPEPVPLLPAEESGESYKFRHVLMRESAYKAIAKQTRAELHERYATWLEAAASPERLPEFDELIGFHLAEAYQYRKELGSDSEEYRRLARKAGERLAAAGRRAYNRGNIQVSLKLLERAVGLLPEGHQARLDAALDLADALTEAGEFERAVGVYEDVVAAAKAARQQALLMHARLGLLDVWAFRDPERMLGGGSSEIQEAILQFVKLGDELGLAKARRLMAYVNFAVGRTGVAEKEARRAIELAQKHRLEYLESKARRLLCIILFWGPTPLSNVVHYAEETLGWARARNIASLQAGALNVLGRAAAMRGDFERARQLNQRGRDISIDKGEVLTAAADSVALGLVELLANKPAAAEATLRESYEALEEMRGTGPLANVAAMLARALIVQGNDEEAEQLTRICEEIAATSQLDSQIRWRALRAIILARRGKLAEAEDLAKEAVEWAGGCEQPDTQAEAYADLAQVLSLAGKREEATEVLERAIVLYRRKGNVVAAGKLRKRQPAQPRPGRRRTPEPA
jgi:class 3 adenylate cyclase/tetratricopeptide (TPR) repeat protein